MDVCFFIPLSKFVKSKSCKVVQTKNESQFSTESLFTLRYDVHFLSGTVEVTLSNPLPFSQIWHGICHLLYCNPFSSTV